MITQEQTHLLKTVFLDNGRELLDNKGKSSLLYNLHILAADDDDDPKLKAISSTRNVNQQQQLRLQKIINRSNKQLLPDKLQFEIGSSRKNKNQFLDNALRLCVHEGLVPASVVLADDRLHQNRSNGLSFSSSSMENSNINNDSSADSTANTTTSIIAAIKRRKRLANEKIKIA